MVVITARFGWRGEDESMRWVGMACAYAGCGGLRPSVHTRVHVEYLGSGLQRVHEEENTPQRYSWPK